MFGLLHFLLCFVVHLVFLCANVINDAKSNPRSLLHHLIWNVITPWLLLLYQDGGSEANPSSFALNEIGLTDWFMYVKRRANKRTQRSHKVWEQSGSGEGSRGYMDDAWPPDGGRRVLSQTETNGVWETERKKFRHMPADLSPFFKLINTGKCVFGCVCVLVWREVLSVSLPIKIRNIVTLRQPCLTPPWPSNLCTCLYLISDPVIL